MNTPRPLLSSRPAGALLAAVAAVAMAAAQAAQAPAGATLSLSDCQLDGVPHAARCGVLKRPLDPAKPQGKQIDLHVAVIPAIARNKAADPVFMFAGGPGQGAIGLAGPVRQMMKRFLNRRDIVLIDQRGTGQSAPLQCDDSSEGLDLEAGADPNRMRREMTTCRDALQKLAWGDLKQYTTTIAMADFEAVRQALGYGPINAIGASYGTRAVLEYARQFPQSVRRLVIDGVAPPDMALPLSLSADAQAAFDAMLADCEKDATCKKRYPNLRSDWQALLASLPQRVTVLDPLTGKPHSGPVGKDLLINAVRGVLYVPQLTSALPEAITQAAKGNWVPLTGLGGAMASNPNSRLAMGMHFSVICAEDGRKLDQPNAPRGKDFADYALQQYRDVCEIWPQGDVPAAFFSVAPSPVAALVLSGGIDPVTPAHHGERVAKALGPKAKHIVAPNIGHGVMGSVDCMRDVVYRFVNAPDDAAALASLNTAACVAQIPRPTVFVPVQRKDAGKANQAPPLPPDPASAAARAASAAQKGAQP